jgi:hypothetical protein
LKEEVQHRERDVWSGESLLSETLASTAAVAAARPETAAWAMWGGCWTVAFNDLSSFPMIARLMELAYGACSR